ncbi:GGDEF domain-containing protein [Pseudoalteromonas piscicida]|uniref:GGDEF domain-containing protein n=1 Tax=Pseudoalteromonas piscicida TaxID=43662 RepID=UPI000E358D46|nr:diguanylate cyclase [Pseudoalteromonas piscicida]
MLLINCFIFWGVTIQLSCRHKITASFGVGSLQHGQDLSEMLKRVDSALYQAKKAGRNCIRVEPE